METQDQTTQTPSSGDSGEINTGQKSSRRRRRLVPFAVALFIVLILCMPWNASVGAYVALIAVPGQEAIIRATERATLVELRFDKAGGIATGLYKLARLIAESRPDIVQGWMYFDDLAAGAALPWDTVRPAVNAMWDRLGGIISPRDPSRGVREWL